MIEQPDDEEFDASCFIVPSAEEIDGSRPVHLPPAAQVPDLSFTYRRDPDGPEWLNTPGVSGGYVVVHSGPGPAKIAAAAVLVGDDGEVRITNPEGGNGLEFEDCTVVDDTEPGQP